MKKSFGLGIGIGIFAALALLTIFLGTLAVQQTLSGAKEENVLRSTPKKLARPKTPGKVSAQTLFETYEFNEVLADDMYRGKEFIVTGVVGSVQKDLADEEPYVALVVDHPLLAVHCYFASKSQGFLWKLRPGDEVEFYATGAGKKLVVMLRDCRIKKMVHQEAK